MTWHAQSTDLMDGTDLTDKSAQNKAEGKVPSKNPEISRQNQSSAASNPSDRSDLSDKVRGQYRKPPQITQAQLQRLKEQVLKEKAEIEKKIRDGSAKPEDLVMVQKKLDWIQIREKELSGKE